MQHTVQMVVFVVKWYAVREDIKWRFAVCKGGGGVTHIMKIRWQHGTVLNMLVNMFTVVKIRSKLLIGPFMCLPTCNGQTGVKVYVMYEHTCVYDDLSWPQYFVYKDLQFDVTYIVIFKVRIILFSKCTETSNNI